MDRRTFMAGAAALGTAALTRSHAAPPPIGRVARSRRYRKALKLGMIAEGGTLLEKFTAARAAGFDGVELDAPSDLNTREVIEARDQTGIIIPGVVNSAHWSKPLNHPDEAVREEGIAALETAIQSASAWCSPTNTADPNRTVLLVPAVVNRDMSYQDAWALSLKGIAEVLPVAREKRVIIAIENVWNEFLLSPREAAAYVDEINDLAGERVCGWYFDVGNVWRYGWPEHWIDVLGDRIVRLDIKGYSRQKSDAEGSWAGFGVEIDEGDLDWAAVRAALERARYHGWATAEVGGGDAARLADIASRMNRVLGM
ncbi:MAG: sugar phosphate isomerase/epimerase family protein [Phycisphaerales bacterium]